MQPPVVDGELERTARRSALPRVEHGGADGAVVGKQPPLVALGEVACRPDCLGVDLAVRRS